MASTVIAGKPSNTVGDKNSTLVLRGSSVKILWGNKFIDLIKNGKINAESDNILKTIDSIDNVKTDGIYLIEDSIWAVIGGTKVLLSGDNTTTYVSFLTELKEVTAELKNRALTNIGFYYDTYEQALNAGLTSGLIYVLGDNKLYVVKDGILVEYMPTSININKEEVIEKLLISEYSLVVDGTNYITCDNNTITAHKLFYLENGLNSLGATNSYGYRLYMKNGESYLEIDNLIQRKVTANIDIYSTKYYLEENIILSAKEVEEIEETDYISNLVLTLLYSNKYKVGDILTTSILLDDEIEYTNEDGEPDTRIEKILIPIDFIITLIGENNTYQVSTESDKITSNTILYLENKHIYYKQGLLPVARLSDHNYDLFKPNVEQTTENINTRIGNISELGVKILENDIVEDNTLGIYSNNDILENSNFIESKLFGATFKPFKSEESIDNYPKYDELLHIPLDLKNNSFDLAIPNIAWIKKLFDVVIPVGTIVMWSGTEIPEGWTICDGNNGTPNLIGRFIKADTNIGENNPSGVEIINGLNTIKLTKENLPEHTHPHDIHSHQIDDITGQTNDVSVLSTVTELTAIQNVQGENITISEGYSGDNTSAEAHSHTITINGMITLEAESKEKEQTWENNPITIEPYSYSLMFIMKTETFTNSSAED